MLKFSGLILYLIVIGGGCNMTEAVSNVSAVEQSQDDPILKKIAEHAAKNFSLSSGDISVKEVSLKDLPLGVRQFYVSEKNVSDGKRYNYLLQENRLYSSGVDADFGRFLKDNNFLGRKELDAKWFQTILWKLNDFSNQLLIDEERLNKPAENLKPFLNKVSTPALERTDNRAVYKFYTQSVTVRPVQKFEVIVPADYQVKFDREMVTP